MEKIKYLNNWKLDKNISNADRSAEVNITLMYPDVHKFIDLAPKERIKKIDLIYKENYEKLISLGLFEKFEITGGKKRTLGVKAKVKFNSLVILKELDFVSDVYIESIDFANKIKPKEAPFARYYCVKMTVVIEVEGVSSKKQSIEKRFVLVKAQTSDDAYKKLDKRKDEYAKPYLNSDGRFVRWRIESFDDCYETDILSSKDIDQEEGVEVYSELKSRKVNSPIVWNMK
ncbi:MAG: DUF4288 domain-containing protein [Sphingobacteriales bacterium]